MLPFHLLFLPLITFFHFPSLYYLCSFHFLLFFLPQYSLFTFTHTCQFSFPMFPLLKYSLVFYLSVIQPIFYFLPIFYTSPFSLLSIFSFFLLLFSLCCVLYQLLLFLFLHLLSSRPLCLFLWVLHFSSHSLFLSILIFPSPVTSIIISSVIVFNSSFLSLSFSAIFFPSFPDLSSRFSFFLHHLHLFFLLSLSFSPPFITSIFYLLYLPLPSHLRLPASARRFPSHLFLLLTCSFHLFKRRAS